MPPGPTSTTGSIPNYPPPPFLKYVHRHLCLIVQFPVSSAPKPPGRPLETNQFLRSRNRKLLLLSLTAAPIGAYLYLKARQTDNKNDAVKIEEEGRRAWVQGGGGEVAKGEAVGADGAAVGRNYAVRVGRSGGGV